MPEKRGCRCGQREKWRVVQYHCNYSAFSGYRYTPSDYSLITCDGCGAYWRTKAKYVETLPRSESPPLSHGYRRHRETWFGH